jgi:uncharacterized protein YdeI (BOF family)
LYSSYREAQSSAFAVTAADGVEVQIEKSSDPYHHQPMKKILLALLALSILAGISSTLSHAAPPAPPYHLTTVSWVVATRNNIDKDDRYVTLIGRVTKKTGDETYFFTDGTGMVRLDSEDFELPIGPKIVVGGRIDQAYLGFGHLEVDVRQWHYARKP